MAGLERPIVAPSVEEGHLHPPTSPAVSDKTVVAAPTDTEMGKPGQKRALFSTELGLRPPCAAIPGPPPFPMTVRSAKVTGILDAARLWRDKFPRLATSIFPGCDWVVEDFWDAKDIQVDGAEHCQDVLEFLMADNVHCAQLFARDWSKKYAEHMATTIGLADLKGIYDPANPEAIVEKIFIHGEITKFSRQFLWHAAHMMRGTMVAMEARQKLAKGGSANSAMPPPVDQKPSVDGEPLVVDGSTAVKKRSKSNRKKTHTRSQGLTAVSEPSPRTQTIPISAIPPQAPAQQPPVAPQKGRAPSHGLPQPAFNNGLPHNGQPVGHAMSSLTSPSMHMAPLHVVKGGGQVYGQPPHGMRQLSYGEQFPRGSSGAYLARGPSGSMSHTHSPHMNPASLVMGQPPMAPPFAQQPFQPPFPPMSPSAYPAQPYHPAMGPPGVAPLPGMGPPHMMSMPSPSMQPGYMHQGPGDRGPRGMLFGDMTNQAPYSSQMPPNMGAQHRGNRRNSSYGNGPCPLFDPYDGARPAFNEMHVGKKPNRNNYARKSSFADQRPRTGSYGYPRAEFGHGDYYSMKPRQVDDPNILNDKIYGCGETWIGPGNITVKDLFIGDLTDAHHHRDVTVMFEKMVSITPSNVTIKVGNTGNRYHAFVTFNTTSDAQKALAVNESNPVVRDHPVRVTVPRRHFQKNPDPFDSQDSSRLDKQPGQNRNHQGTARLSSQGDSSNVTVPEDQGNGTQYSPQDVRSDPSGKTSRRSSDALVVSGGSPDVRRSKNRKDSTIEKLKISPEDSIEEEATVAEVTGSDVAAKSADAQTDLSDATAESSSVVNAERPLEPAAEVAKSAAPGDTDDTLNQSSVQAISVGDTNAVIGKLALSSSVPTNLQTKEVLKETEIAGPIVKIPSATASRAPAVSQVQEMSGNADVPKTSGDSPTAIKAAAEVPNAAHEEPANLHKESTDVKAKSLGELAEAVTSVVTTQQESTAVVDASAGPVVESVPASHGTQPPVPSSIKKPVLKSPTMHASAATDLSAPPPIPATTVAKTSEIAAPTTSVVTDPTEKQDIQEDAKETTKPAEDLIVSTDSTAGMITTSAESAADAIKRNGPQQTASLNPFAKPTKAQREREKAALKKEKKKREQEEKAAKAKSGKSASPAALQKPAVETTATALASPKSDRPASHVVDSKQTGASTPLALADDAENKGKGKERLSAAVSSTTTTSEGTAEDASGKQIGGTTTTIPDKTGSVTEKTKVAQNIMEASSTKDLPPLLPLAQFLEHSGTAQTHPGRLPDPPELAVKATASTTVSNKKKAPSALSKLNVSSSSKQDNSPQSNLPTHAVTPLPVTTNPTTTGKLSDARIS